MKTDLLYIGDIKICTKYERLTFFRSDPINQKPDSFTFGLLDEKSEIYKKDAILIKTPNGGYIDLDDFDLLTSIQLKMMEVSKLFDIYNKILRTQCSWKGDIFVDESSLIPIARKKQNVSVKQLKKVWKNCPDKI